MRDVRRRIGELAVAERPLRPVRGAARPSAGGSRSGRSTSADRAHRRVAEELRADHRVEQPVEAEATVPLQHEQVVLGGVEDLPNVRCGEQLRQRLELVGARRAAADRRGKISFFVAICTSRSCRSSGRRSRPRYRRRRPSPASGRGRAHRVGCGLDALKLAHSNPRSTKGPAADCREGAEGDGSGERS